MKLALSELADGCRDFSAASYAWFIFIIWFRENLEIFLAGASPLTEDQALDPIRTPGQMALLKQFHQIYFEIFLSLDYFVSICAALEKFRRFNFEKYFYDVIDI